MATTTTHLYIFKYRTPPRLTKVNNHELHQRSTADNMMSSSSTGKVENELDEGEGHDRRPKMMLGTTPIANKGRKENSDRVSTTSRALQMFMCSYRPKAGAHGKLDKE